MENKKKNGKKVALIVTCGVLALILVVLLAILIMGKSLLGQINRYDPNAGTLSNEQLESILNETDSMESDFSGTIMDSDDADMSDNPADIVKSDNVINILLVGQDRRKGQVRQRSDAMILCTINKEQKTLVMTSFMRDTWVKIPGHYDERLNVPYAIRGGGFELLNETLEYNFGVSVDYNVEVDFAGFTKVIDKVGGVDVSLTSAEASFLNKRYNWNLKKGVNHLDGSQALSYSRIRKLDSDFGRTQRQRTVLTSLFNKVSKMSVVKIYQVVNDILPTITTDMTDKQILALVGDLAPLLPELKLSAQRVPINNGYAFARIDGKSVLYMSPENLEKNRQFLKETLGLDTLNTPAE